MPRKSSVETLREERAKLLAPSDQMGPMALTVRQENHWRALRVAVIDAQIAEDEYLNSLLPEPLTEERRAAIIEDLWGEVCDADGREAADMVDFSHESDFSLVQDHERYLEDKADNEPA